MGKLIKIKKLRVLEGIWAILEGFRVRSIRFVICVLRTLLGHSKQFPKICIVQILSAF